MNLPRGKSSNWAFTLVEIMIVVAIIGLLAAIAVPNFIRARKKAWTSSCLNNLRKIDTAVQQWAIATGNSTSVPVDKAAIVVYLGRGTGSANQIFCPYGNSKVPWSGYTITTVDTPSTCDNYDAIEHPAELH